MKYVDVMKYCLSLPGAERKPVSPELFEALPAPPQIRKATDKEDGDWITIQRVENFDTEHLKQLITWSYHQALN